jgi:uncharacterized protein YbbC (DUF1343 family)
LDRIHASPNLNLTRLFAPEHGIRGDYTAGAKIPSGTDPITGLPVSSLYNETYTPTAEMLNDVDVLVVDLQDVGVHFWTYNVTAVLCLVAGAEHKRPVVILDRPNPIGGVQVEGPLVEAGYESFVGRINQPMRHGCTYGELCRTANEGEGIGADLHVVQCEGWSRDRWWDEAGLPWVIPSPNMPTLDTATVYPGTCLFEGTLLTEGRGLTRPYETIGAPWVEPYRWVAALDERKLPGVRFRPLWFQPMARKHAGVQCGGVQLHVTDRDAFRPVEAAIHMIETVRNLWPSEFGWREGTSGRSLHIDRLYGSDRLRHLLDEGKDAAAIIKTWDQSRFLKLRENVLLYT